MNLLQLEEAGVFVAARPVIKEMKFLGLDKDGEIVEHTTTVAVRSLSYADFELLRKDYSAFEIARNAEIEAFKALTDESKEDLLEPPAPNWQMALVAAAIRFGAKHQEAMSIERAHALGHALARPLFLIALEENAAVKKKVKPGGRVLARDGAERDRGQDDSGSAGELVPAGGSGLDGVLPAQGNPESQPQD